MENKIYTLKEAAKFLHIEIKTMRNWIAKGNITAFKYPNGKKWMIAESELERLLNNCTTNK